MPGSKNRKSLASMNIKSTSMAMQRGELEENSSEENILFHGNAITKTVAVTVDTILVNESREGSTWSRKNEMIPERRIDDMV